MPMVAFGLTSAPLGLPSSVTQRSDLPHTSLVLRKNYSVYPQGKMHRHHRLGAAERSFATFLVIIFGVTLPLAAIFPPGALVDHVLEWEAETAEREGILLRRHVAHFPRFPVFQDDLLHLLDL
ncbi:hypothetical protein C8R45DRAFT_1095911 [Mycena sanguinolenta]|nr:hypothetical protein C8R45DRAFT_1095911 [Mycena sanguinolenta]